MTISVKCHVHATILQKGNFARRVLKLYIFLIIINMHEAALPTPSICKNFLSAFAGNLTVW